jgi:hypothetical protein
MAEDNLDVVDLREVIDAATIILIGVVLAEARLNLLCYSANFDSICFSLILGFSPLFLLN